MFGDKKYDECELNSFYLGHSKGPASFLLGNLLRQPYFAAQSRGQVLIQQSYPYNIQNLLTDLANDRGFIGASASVYTGIARGWVLIPRETTHLVCDLVFAMRHVEATEVSHKLVARNGSGCDVATDDVEYPAAENAFDATFSTSNRYNPADARLARLSNASFPYVLGAEIITHKFELALDNVVISAPGICQVRVEALANRTTNGSTFATPTPYQPLWVQVTGEIRY